MSCSTRFALLAVLIASPSARGQIGRQPSPCTYQRCALRVEAVPGSPNNSHLVQGIEARPVETSGFFVPRIPLFEASPDSIRIPYEAFRTRAAMTHGFFAAFGAALVVQAISASHYRTPPPFKFSPDLGLDLGLGVAALVEAKRSGEALQTAIARYNAALPDP